MASALPRSVTSPVMAMSLRTGICVSTDTMDVHHGEARRRPVLRASPPRARGRGCRSCRTSEA
jgi:hypothetical protein